MKTPKGTRDSDPNTERLRQEILKDCERIFALFDAKRMDTPSFELYDILIKEKEDKEIFILENKKDSGEKCGLRYDLTVPFSRYVKMNNIKYMKRYQIGKVFRRDKPSPGRYREFTQCDYDCLGNNNSTLTDIETLQILNMLFKNLKEKFNLPNYIIRINSREILQDIMIKSGIPEDLFSTICSSIDKLDKCDWKEVSIEMSNKGLSEKSINILQNILFGNEKIDTESIDKILKLDIPVKLDLTLARGLSYYSGLIFEVVLQDQKSLSISGGGRYDNLCGIPCIGFSLGIDRIIDYVKYDFSQTIKVYVVEMNKQNKNEITDYRMKIAMTLRENNIPTSTSIKNKTVVKKEIAYASDDKIPYVILIGEEEYNTNTILIKNLETKEQKNFNLDEMLNFFF